MQANQTVHLFVTEEGVNATEKALGSAQTGPMGQWLFDVTPDENLEYGDLSFRVVRDTTNATLATFTARYPTPIDKFARGTKALTLALLLAGAWLLVVCVAACCLVKQNRDRLAKEKLQLNGGGEASQPRPAPSAHSAAQPLEKRNGLAATEMVRRPMSPSRELERQEDEQKSATAADEGLMVHV